MSFASFVCFLFVVGLGAFVVFVYIDFGNTFEYIHESRTYLLVYTLMFAGKAFLATTITTAMSFFANVVLGTSESTWCSLSCLVGPRITMTHILFPVQWCVMISSVLSGSCPSVSTQVLRRLKAQCPKLSPDDHERNRRQQVLDDFFVAVSVLEDLLRRVALVSIRASSLEFLRQFDKFIPVVLV